MKLYKAGADIIVIDDNVEVELVKKPTYRIEWYYRGELRSIRFVANNEKGAHDIARLFLDYILEKPDYNEYEVFEEKNDDNK